MKYRILFTCHGNICRSAMAEFMLKDMVQKAGRGDEVYIESATTHNDEIGNPVYPPVAKILTRMGIDCGGKRARQLSAGDYGKYDLIIGMDRANMRNMERAFGGDPEGKLRMLMDYTDRPGEVADPWYTRDFEATWVDLLEGCRGLLESL